MSRIRTLIVTAAAVLASVPARAADPPPLPPVPGDPEPWPGPAARLLDPVAAAPPVDYPAVERVRRSDPRYAGLRFDLRDGRVVIGGSGDPTAAWELARRVAPLVGDRDVVVERGR